MKIFISILIFVLSFTAVLLIPTSAKPAPDAPAFSSSDRKRKTILSDQKIPRHELAKIARLPDPEERLHHLVALANSIPIDQLKDWLTPSALASLDGSLRSLFLTLTCDRWLETAPADLIRWNSYTDLIDAHQYLARWLLADRDSATSYLHTQPTGSHPGYSMSQSIQNLAKLDFHLALDLAVEQFAKLPTQEHWRNATFVALAEQDLPALISLSSSLPEAAQEMIRPAIVASLLKSDFSSAISYLLDCDDGPEQLLAFGDIMGSDSFTNALVTNLDKLPDGWLQKILEKQGRLSRDLENHLNTINDPSPKLIALDRVASIDAILDAQEPATSAKLPSVTRMVDWSPSETQEALSAFKNASAAGQRATLENIESWWTSEGTNRLYISEVLTTIARQTPPEDPERLQKDLRITSTLATEWAIDSPSQAAAWVRKLPEGDHRLWAAKNVALVWQNYDPAEAASWIKTLPTADQAAVNRFD